MASIDIIEESNSRTMDPGSETRASSLIDATWIRKNIKMRRCKHFVSSEEDPTICHCGYENQYHTTPLISESNSDEETEADSKWEFSKNTETEPTNAFGEIQFNGREGDIKRKFVRVDINTEMSVMLEMIQKRWKMEYPNLLISVAGDDDFVWHRTKLQDGLMKVTRKIGAWFITDGTIHDWMYRCLPEDAKICKEHAVIGIAPWGVIRHRKDLENEQGLWPALYIKSKRAKRSDERFLDPNHSHYILVDDGTQNKLDIEIPFRVKLEQEMAKMKTKSGNDVLIVTLVMGGGQGTLQKVDEALKQDTPVIVVKGSGGAADLLAFAFQNALTCDEYVNPSRGQDSKRNEKFMPKSLEDRIKEQMKQKDISCKIKIIKSCLLKSDQIHIFDLDSDDYEINDVLLNALMKANSYFVKSPGIIPPDEIMLSALKCGRADIVSQLIEKEKGPRGFAKFLTAGRLVELYNSAISKRNFNVTRFRKQKKIRLFDVMYLVQELVDIDLLQRYMDVGPEKEGKKNIDDADLMKHPSSEILIWSVLTNQQDIAKYFWRCGKNKLSTALVAHSLFSALPRQTDDQGLRDAIDHNSSEFMTLAIKVAEACYKADENKTYDLLTRSVPQWGNTTCIEIAMNANNKGFISLKMCSNLFDKIWMGGLKPQNSIKRLLLCIAFPPLIIWLARFEEEDQKNSSSDTNKNDGQKTFCCLPSKRRNVGIEAQAEASDSDEKSARCMNPCWKLKSFYTAPIIIFMHNIIFFIAFLVLYSYVLISKLEPHMSVEVVCLILWVLSSLIGEIRQFSRIEALSIWKKWKVYKADGWNVLDMLTILLFIIGMLVLMIDPQPLSVEIARVILGIDLVCFFLRILHAFHAHRQVGPKLVMIMNMVWDLGTLAAILGVFILAYGVASYAILYPNTALTIDTLMKILKRPYWNIFGELVMEEIEGLMFSLFKQGEVNCSDNEAVYGNGTVPRCPTKSGQYVVPVMMGIYMLMTNTLLISLLIALFSYSIEKVHKHTDLHCSHHRYNLICEFNAKPWLPHPFAILIYLPQIMVYIWRKFRHCLCSSRKYPNKVVIFGRRNVFEKINITEDWELCWFEGFHAVKVYERMEQNPEESIDIIARNTRLETKVESKFKKLAQQVLKAEVEQLKQQILKYQNDMSMQLQTIMDSLKELKEHKLETKQTCNEDTDEK